MSALFGFINKNGKPAEKVFLNKILQAVSHRATDGSFSWLHHNVAMGNCRLIVYPQHHFEQQPLEIGHLTITADARIDNRNELASYFELDRHLLSITPDSQLILQAYQKWGQKCVDHLEGGFAFAIWDKQNQHLFAATDHIGFRPFFYYDSPDVFIFCSEIKGVVAAKPLPNYFNDESLIEYFYRKGTPNQTYNKEVFALCGGNTLTLQNGNISINKYWNLESTGKYSFKRDEDWYDCTRELLYRAVEKRLNPDMPIGIKLSGGLDSTSIACILSELLMKKNKPLYAFSSVLPIDHKGIEKDERNYIEIVGRQCPNIIQTYVEASGTGPFSNLEESFQMEENFLSSTFYMNRALLHEAKEKKIRILFSGFGGDYWFSWKGSSAIYELMQQGYYRNAFRLMHQFSKTEQQSLLHIFRGMYISHTSWYKRLREIFREKETNWTEQTTLHKHFVENYSTQIDRHSNYDNTTLIQALINDGSIGRMKSRFYNLNSTYKMDSAIPLFDKDIFELLSDLPLYFFVNGGCKRSLIRNIMEGINPPEVNKRKDKLPFSPECVKRIYGDRGLVKQLINSPSYSFIFDRYIDKKLINNHIDNIPCVYTGTSDDIIGLRIAQSGIASVVLKHLSDSNYIFD